MPALRLPLHGPGLRVRHRREAQSDRLRHYRRQGAPAQLTSWSGAPTVKARSRPQLVRLWEGGRAKSSARAIR